MSFFSQLWLCLAWPSASSHSRRPEIRPHTHSRRRHDDLGPPEAGEEHRAQLLGCGDQGAGGDLQRPLGPVQLADVGDRRADLQRGGLQRGHGHGVETPQRPRQELETRLQGVRVCPLSLTDTPNQIEINPEEPGFPWTLNIWGNVWFLLNST